MVDTHDDRALKVGVDALEEDFAEDGGDRGQNEAAADGARERNGVRVGRVGGGRCSRQILSLV